MLSHCSNDCGQLSCMRVMTRSRTLSTWYFVAIFITGVRRMGRSGSKRGSERYLHGRVVSGKEHTRMCESLPGVVQRRAEGCDLLCRVGEADEGRPVVYLLCGCVWEREHPREHG